MIIAFEEDIIHSSTSCGALSTNSGLLERDKINMMYTVYNINNTRSINPVSKLGGRVSGFEN